MTVHLPGDLLRAPAEGLWVVGDVHGALGKLRALLRRARLIDEADAEWFSLTLAEAETKPEDRSRFDDQELGYVEDVVGELAAALDDPEGEDEEASEPLRNPNRDVGRNDPCPCGSGKKFKKCCLEAA